MPFIEYVKKRKRKNVHPTIAIDKAGLYLNHAAVERIGDDKKAVRLFFEGESTPNAIGLWFSKEKVGTEWMKAYAVVHYKTGVAKISCSRFIEANNLLAIKRKLGKASFLFFLDKKQETGPDFYTVPLE